MLAQQRLQREARVAERMRQSARAVTGSDDRADPEAVQSQSFDVHGLPQRRVGRVEHLEAVVTEEAVDVVGADPAPDLAFRLKHHNAAPVLFKAPSCPQPGDPRSDDNDVRIHVAPFGVVARQSAGATRAVPERGGENAALLGAEAPQKRLVQNGSNE